MKSKTTKPTMTKEQQIEIARVDQLRASAAATMKKNKDAAPTAVIRKLAHAKALSSTPRRAFLAVFTAAPYKLSRNTVSTQYQWGRSGARA